MSLSVDDYLNGQTLLIDKPLEWTSFQIVNKIRHQIKKKFNLRKIKVGHAGTLDPLASGLLIVCTGKNTKIIQDIQNADKEYTGSIKLGTKSGSYDGEGPFTHNIDYSHVNEALILETTEKFTGEIMQQPPAHSALKKDGKPLYEYARAGEEIDIPKRKVRIDHFEITSIELPEIHFKIRCSKGTYIRSIANDFGLEMNTGSYLSSLRRTEIGKYNVNEAIAIADWQP